MHRSRQRRRAGLISVLIDIRTTDVAELVRRGLLAPGETADPRAIEKALGRFLDRALVP